jgi:TPR repeat protein
MMRRLSLLCLGVTLLLSGGCQLDRLTRPGDESREAVAGAGEEAAGVSATANDRAPERERMKQIRAMDTPSLQDAADRGDVLAQRIAGFRYITGQNAEQDPALGERYMLSAARSGDSVAVNALMEYYARGPFDAGAQRYPAEWKTDWARICGLSAELARGKRLEELNGNSRFLAAHCYLEGIAVQQDIQHGIGLMTTAAEAFHHLPSALRLVRIYESGIPGVDADANAARKWTGVANNNRAWQQERTWCLRQLNAGTGMKVEQAERCQTLLSQPR